MGGVVAGERVREHCVACGGSGGWRRGRARRPRARAPLLHPPPPPAATPWPSPPPCASQRRPSPWRRPPRPARHGGGPSRKSLWATSPPATPPCWPAATIAATQTMGRCVCQEEKGREWRARSGDRRARARGDPPSPPLPRRLHGVRPGPGRGRRLSVRPHPVAGVRGLQGAVGGGGAGARRGRTRACGRRASSSTLTSAYTLPTARGRPRAGLGRPSSLPPPAPRGRRRRRWRGCGGSRHGGCSRRHSRRRPAQGLPPLWRPPPPSPLDLGRAARAHPPPHLGRLDAARRRLGWVEAWVGVGGGVGRWREWWRRGWRGRRRARRGARAAAAARQPVCVTRVPWRRPCNEGEWANERRERDGNRAREKTGAATTHPLPPSLLTCAPEAAPRAQRRPCARSAAASSCPWPGRRSATD